MTRSRALCLLCCLVLVAVAACRPTIAPTLFPTITPSLPAPTATIKPMEATASPTPTVTPTATRVPATPTPTQVATLPLRNILAVSFIDASSGWLLGDACTPADTACHNRPIVLRHSADGGRHWQALPAPLAYSSATVDYPGKAVIGLLFIDAHNGWLYGPATYSTRDGGYTWQAASQPILAMAKQGKRLWAAVSAGDGWQMVTSDDAGISWIESPQQTTWVGSSPQLAVLDDSHAWVLANADFTWYLWRTADGGVTWEALPAADQPFRAVRLLQTDASGRLWLFSADQPAGGSQSKALYTSVDRGVSWKIVAGPPYDAMAPCSLPWSGELAARSQSLATNGRAWFLALDRYTLISSADGGCVWNEAIPFEQANLGDATVIGVAFADSTHGWAPATPNRLFITANGGDSWEMTPVD